MSIWNHKKINANFLESVKRITLNEGFTPEEIIHDSKTNLILKREDMNPSGSWKDRGSAYIITKLLTEDKTQAVIASSGNAAISLMTYANLVSNFKLHVVISNSVTKDKRDLILKLANKKHEVYEVDEIRVKAVELSSSLKVPNLKVSVDDDILPGYWSLGLEMGKHFAKEDNSNNAIFIQVSSGATLVGVAQGLQMVITNEYNLPKIFVVQTQKVAPIVSMLHKDFKALDFSISDAIIDNKALRSPQILKIISQTQGDALAIHDDEILEARSFLDSSKVNSASINSLLSVAGYIRLKKVYNFSKVICILSGR